MSEFIPITLISAAAATGAGGAVRMPFPATAITAEISWTVTGAGADKAVTALVVAFEGSISGDTFEAMQTATTLSGGELTAKYCLTSVNGKPVTYIRANPTTVTITGSTGTVTLTIKILPAR